MLPAYQYVTRKDLTHFFWNFSFYRVTRPFFSIRSRSFPTFFPPSLSLSSPYSLLDFTVLFSLDFPSPHFPTTWHSRSRWRDWFDSDRTTIRAWFRFSTVVLPSPRLPQCQSLSFLFSSVLILRWLTSHSLEFHILWLSSRKWRHRDWRVSSCSRRPEELGNTQHCTTS